MKGGARWSISGINSRYKQVVLKRGADRRGVSGIYSSYKQMVLVQAVYVVCHWYR